MLWSVLILDSTIIDLGLDEKKIHRRAASKEKVRTRNEVVVSGIEDLEEKIKKKPKNGKD